MLRAIWSITNRSSDNLFEKIALVDEFDDKTYLKNTYGKLNRVFIEKMYSYAPKNVKDNSKHVFLVQNDAEGQDIALKNANI